MDEEPVPPYRGGDPVGPRDVLATLLERRLPQGVPDCCGCVARERRWLAADPPNATPDNTLSTVRRNPLVRSVVIVLV